MRVLSGIQPSGKLHLGNYFGYVVPNLEWAKKSDQSYFMIADLHALTSLKDPKELKNNVTDAALDLLASGLDPEKIVLFRQSDVHEHSELFWILTTVSPMGLLERAVSYKEKVEKGIPASVGLFTYPVLQSADVVLYDIDKVPIGKDQQQHLEMVRDIAIKFNNAFGETFTIPQGVVTEAAGVVPGTDGQKMSKSYGNTIPLFGDEKAIQKAIMGIVSDSKGVADPKDPETSVIYGIHKLLLSTSDAKALADKYKAGGMGYGDAKKLLFAAYMDHFGSMRKKREELLKKTSYVDEVLIDGAKKASAVAKKTMERARKAVGLQ